MFIAFSIIFLYNSFSCLCLLCHPHQYVHGVQLPRVKVWNSLMTKEFYFWSGCEFGRGLIFSIFSYWLVNLVKVDHRRETFNTIFCGLLLVVDPTKICDCEYGAIVQGVSKKLSFAKLSVCRSCCQLGRNTFYICGKSVNAQFGKTQFFWDTL